MAMTAADFMRVKKRDFDNGAVRDEIAKALEDRERLLAACERAETFFRWADMLGQESRAASLLDTLSMLRTAIAKAKD